MYEDLLDRKTVLGLHVNAGFIPIGNSVFFERFYGGGIGSIRGFRFRGVSPRGGRADVVMRVAGVSRISGDERTAETFGRPRQGGVLVESIALAGETGPC